MENNRLNRKQGRGQGALPSFPFIWMLLILTTALSGCVTLKDPETSQVYRADRIGIVQEGQTFGQTFVSRRSDFNGVQLWLRPGGDAPQDGALTVELYHSPQDPDPLASNNLSLARIQNEFPVTVNFPSQKDPANQPYYLELKTADGTVQVFGRDEDAYAQGSLYINGVPQNGDMSFRASYDYGAAAILEDSQRALGNLWLIIPLLLVLWLPGRTILQLTILRSGSEKEQSLDWGERFAISIGLSLALLPLLMLWTATIGFHWSQGSVILGWFLLLSLYLWLVRRSIRTLWKARRIYLPPGWGINIALSAIFLLSLGVRLAMVRDMAAPAWVDSVHHATITRLIIEGGALPATYSPYMENISANYHSGFHISLAFFNWLAGMELSQAMLLYGQVLNALSIFAVYLFTTTFIGNRKAAVVAALITGLNTPMPAYYTSWGRYTQLAGLLILPPAFWLIRRLLLKPDAQNTPSRLQLPRAVLPTFLAASVACAGLLLTHYRVTAFLASLLVANLVTQTVRNLRLKAYWKKVPINAAVLLLLGIVAILLTLPWWPATINTLFIPHLVTYNVRVAPFADFSWSYLTTALGKYTMISAGLGLLLAIIKRRWFPFTIGLWICTLFIIANLGAMGLPGTGLISSASVEILLFVPISMFSGYLLGEFLNILQIKIPDRWRATYYSTLAIIGLILALVGAKFLMPILNPITMLFREADRPAMVWVQENIPPKETILINPFLWSVSIYAGNDGGYWITPLAGRPTMPPPVLYALGDGGKNSDRIADISRQVTEWRDNPEALYAYLQGENIHYIYIGGRGGTLSAQSLRYSPLFRTIYSQDGVWIFQLKPWKRTVFPINP